MTERILGRLGEFATRWQALPVGGSITMPWPLDRQNPGPKSSRTAAGGR